MKNLLIDTHIFLWAVTGNPRLGALARKQIQTADQVYVSSLSFLELKIKQSKDKLRLPSDLDQLVGNQGFTILGLYPDQMHGYRIFSENNKDPFDNALLTIAQSQQLNFMTSDANILDLQSVHPWIIDSRK